MRSAAKLSLLAALAGALAGCGPRHQFTRLENGDHTLVATVDYAQAGFGLTHNAVISVQEKQGLASLVATFGNVDHVEVTWLGPEDLNVCQAGQVIGYKTSVPLNTSRGLRTVHVHYQC